MEPAVQSPVGMIDKAMIEAARSKSIPERLDLLEDASSKIHEIRSSGQFAAYLDHVTDVHSSVLQAASEASASVFDNPHQLCPHLHHLTQCLGLLSITHLGTEADLPLVTAVKEDQLLYHTTAKKIAADTSVSDVVDPALSGLLHKTISTLKLYASAVSKRKASGDGADKSVLQNNDLQIYADVCKTLLEISRTCGMSNAVVINLLWKLISLICKTYRSGLDSFLEVTEFAEFLLNQATDMFNKLREATVIGAVETDQTKKTANKALIAVRFFLKHMQLFCCHTGYVSRLKPCLDNLCQLLASIHIWSHVDAKQAPHLDVKTEAAKYLHLLVSTCVRGLAATSEGLLALLNSSCCKSSLGGSNFLTMVVRHGLNDHRFTGAEDSCIIQSVIKYIMRASSLSYELLGQVSGDYLSQIQPTHVELVSILCSVIEVAPPQLSPWIQIELLSGVVGGDLSTALLAVDTWVSITPQILPSVRSTLISQLGTVATKICYCHSKMVLICQVLSSLLCHSDENEQMAFVNEFNFRKENSHALWGYIDILETLPSSQVQQHCAELRDWSLSHWKLWISLPASERSTYGTTDLCTHVAVLLNAWDDHVRQDERKTLVDILSTMLSDQQDLGEEGNRMLGKLMEAMSLVIEDFQVEKLESFVQIICAVLEKQSDTSTPTIELWLLILALSAASEPPIHGLCSLLKYAFSKEGTGWLRSHVELQSFHELVQDVQASLVKTVMNSDAVSGTIKSDYKQFLFLNTKSDDLYISFKDECQRFTTLVKQQKMTTSEMNNTKVVDAAQSKKRKSDADVLPSHKRTKEDDSIDTALTRMSEVATTVVGHAGASKVMSHKQQAQLRAIIRQLEALVE